MTSAATILTRLRFEPAPEKGSDAELDELRTKCPFPLPSEFWEFLTDYGGGEFDSIIWCRSLNPPGHARKSDGACMLDEFFTSAAGDYSLLEMWDTFGEVMNRAVPFAAAPGGNLFCFGPLGDVFFWDHEEDTLVVVAESFANLLDRLFVEE